MIDLLQIIQNIVKAIAPEGTGLTGLLYALSWVIGVVFVIMAVRLAAKSSEQGRGVFGQPGANTSAVAWSFVIGIAFIALPGILQSLTQTFFAQETPAASEIFAYTPATIGMLESGSPARAIIVGMTTIVQFVGVIAVMRGLLLLRATALGGGQGPSHFGAGMTFVISGVMAVNFPLFAGMIELLLTSTGA